MYGRKARGVARAIHPSVRMSLALPSWSMRGPFAGAEGLVDFVMPPYYAIDAGQCKRLYTALMGQTKPRTRLFTDAPLGPGTSCVLDAGAAHKLRAVLRLNAGDDIVLFNGRDGEWQARLERLGKTEATALCTDQTRPQRDEPGPWLAFAPLKKDRMDMVVEKAVELGVERLIPVITRRTETRRLKVERIAQKIREAAEQCERLTLPTLAEPVTLEQFSAHWPNARTLLVCAERREAPSLTDALGRTDGPLGLLVGPEGGFEDSELDAVLKSPKSLPVRLGPRILRAETAALAALAVTQALTGDWTSPTNETTEQGPDPI